jgi:starvation-inducible outer membrane lipoprotein
MRSALFTAICSGLLLSGCATVTPDIDDASVKPPQRWVSERQVINHIQCLLGKAVRTAAREDEHNVATTAPG